MGNNYSSVNWIGCCSFLATGLNNLVEITLPFTLSACRPQLQPESREMQTVTQPSEPLYWGERKHDAPTRVDVFGKLCADSPHRWIGRLEAKTGPSNPIRPQTLAYHHPQAKIQTHKNGQGAANGLPQQFQSHGTSLGIA